MLLHRVALLVRLPVFMLPLLRVRVGTLSLLAVWGLHIVRNSMLPMLLHRVALLVRLPVVLLPLLRVRLGALPVERRHGGLPLTVPDLLLVALLAQLLVIILPLLRIRFGNL